MTVAWSKDSGPGTVTFGNANATSTTATFGADGVYVLRLTATDGALPASDTVQVTVNPAGGDLPPDPTTVAPPLDPTIATTTYAATEFLYTGTNPIQTGVAPGTIDPQRAAVLRGRVLDRQNNPLPGVTLTVLNHPEFGQTLSRADGWFDLTVNGGGWLTVHYQKTGYLPAQRQADVPWQDFVVMDDVVLIPRDARATTVDLTAPTFQVAQGTPVTDGDGTRQATLLIPPGTTAQAYRPDGSLQPLTTLTLRLTEYTVGPNGPQAMPAELPPTSGYTYAVEISADEAPTKIDGRDVLFNQPVVFYLNDFLDFPVGGPVPVGYYDSSRGVWIPSDNGRIVQILRLAGGLAELDVTGTGVPADADALAELGITDAERAQLATLYPVGTRLWRVRLSHLSTWDCNWPFGPPPDAEPPQPPDNDEPPANDEPPDNNDPDDPCEAAGSIIECETQTLGERIPLAGTGLALHYRSNRVPGRRSARTVVIPLSGDRVPASLKRIEYAIGIAGLARYGTVPAQPNQRVRFTWDGRDVYGRQLIGGQPTRVTVKYVYDAVYYGPTAFGAAPRNFGLPGDVVISRDWARREITLTRQRTIPLSALPPTVGLTDLRRGGLGAWTLDLHQVHDPVSQVLYQGDGRQRKPESSLGATTASFLGRVITAFAGTGEAGFAGDGGPAKQAQLTFPVGIAVAPDGGVLIADTGNHRIRRVDTGGRIATVAGTGEAGFAGDGGPATQAQLNAPTAMAVAPDGGILIVDTGNRVVRRIDADGRIATVAGFYWDGGAGIAPAQRASGGATTTARALGLEGDGGPATQVRLSNPQGVAAARDGSVLIADPGAQVIRRISPDGMITTFAGTGQAGFDGDGGPATQAQLNYPAAVVVAPDGGVWIADAGNHRIRRVGPDGRIATVAGTGVGGGFGDGDGGPAIQAQLNFPHHLALARDGTLLIAEGGDARIRRVGGDGIITTWAGGAVGGDDPGDGGLAAGAVFSLLGGLAVAPDGGVLVVDAGDHRVRRIGSGLPKFDGGGFAIATADGDRIDRFDAQGRHQFSADPWTGAIRRTFSYDSLGRLQRIVDADGNVVRIERDFDGNPTVLVAPFGQRTELRVDRSGYLSRVVNPAGETWRMSYTADGLLTEFTDPRGQTARFSYNALGRLNTATDRAGGVQTLTRADTDNGRWFETTRVSGQGRTTRYRLENTPSGAQQRGVTTPAGLRIETRKQPDGAQTTVAPDGTTLTTVPGPDPRFGMQAPRIAQARVSSGGQTATVAATQTVTPGDPAQPPGITTRTDTVTVNGRTTTTVYTTADRSAVTTTPTGRTRTLVLDDQGRFAQARIPGLAPLDLARDGRGRPSQLRQSDGAETRALTFGYGLDGYLQTVTDPLGRVTALTRDPVGRVLRQTDPDGRATEFRYDANGNLASLTPPGRPAHVFGHTPVDQTADYTPPAAGLATPSTRYHYNRDRQLTRIDRPDGQALTVAYDTAGRRSTLTLPTGARSYGYDAVGHLATITAPDGGLNHAYNGALLTQTAWTGAVVGTVGFAHDDDFRLASVSVNGAPIAYRYDADGRLVQAGTLTLSRDPHNGLLTGMTLDGVSDSRTYNGFGELIGHTVQAQGITLLRVTYIRDLLGRITHQTETVQGGTHAIAYAYDPAGRLSEVQRNGVTTTHGYDANGNRTQINGATIATVDAQDRLLTHDDATYTHTANGELQTKTRNGQTTTYAYDVLGNLHQVILPDGKTLDYVIDGQNRRIGKKINGALRQGFLYQDGLRPVAELDGNHQIVSRFVYATGGNAPDYLIQHGQTYRLIKDHLGSPRLVIDAVSGTIVQRIDYDIWGRVLLDTNPGFQPFGFAGGPYDRDTGLVRFGARDYDPETGRWTAKDPILFAGGDANLYSYVQNDPVNWVDSDGQIPILLAVPSLGAAIQYTGTALVGIMVGIGIVEAVNGDSGNDDSLDEDDNGYYKPKTRDRKLGKCDPMGGEDSDPFKGKGPKKGTKEYEDARRELEKLKEKSGRGGKDNISPEDPNI